MKGLENKTLSEMKTLTITCLIDHLYTQIPAENFKMTWSSSKTASSFKNGDGSYGYIIQMRQMLHYSDNGRVVDCTLTLNTGERITESQTIVCMYILNLIFNSIAILHQD